MGYREKIAYDSLLTNAPAVDAEAVTPNDSTEFTPPFRSLYIGGTGDVAITTLDGNNVTFPSVPAGRDLNVIGTHVRATGTTATDIVAYF